MTEMTTRRDFLEHTARSAVGLALPAPLLARGDDWGLGRPPKSFINIGRSPDSVLVQSDAGDVTLSGDANGGWTGRQIVLTTTDRDGATRVSLSAPGVGVKRIHLRWRDRLNDVGLILGDAWERAYGDLEWRGSVPDRVMPWYFATNDGSLTHSYGVRTGARAFCFWQIDPHGVSLWIDARSGTVGVKLEERVLDVCDVVSRAGHPGESAFAALHAFCKTLCVAPRLPSQPVYGSNDWYWAYGNNSAKSVLTDAQHVVELSPTGDNRPFAVIDDGWQPGRGADKVGAGTWDRGNEKFPDMPGLVADVRRTGARAGIWVRPLQATADAPSSWRLSRDKNVFDPTVAGVQEKIANDISRIQLWGFDLIKHDYTTFEIFGRWGFQMGSTLTRDGWTFAEGPGRTTAEVIEDLYRTIRSAAGDSLIIGCNTVSHLSAGHFEICRIGDDTSGTEWQRTRKMGVNSLAFRGVQHGAFYVADADCVGVTTSVPWSLSRQWLDLLARSGTMLVASLASDALGAEQRRDLTAAFAIAAKPQPLGEPLDWQHAVYPTKWRLMNAEKTFDWTGQDGAGG
jgi:alpha-galactosidase